MNRTALIFVLLLSSSVLSGCAVFKWLFGKPEDKVDEIVAMSDQEIQKTIEKFGGKILKKQVKFEGFRVSPTLDGGISINVTPQVGCGKFAWTQVVREWIDGKVVHDPTVLPDASDEKGKRKKWEDKITPGGYVVDGGADGSGLEYPLRDDDTFSDTPHMPNSDLSKNKMKPNAKLYVLEAETCVKCKQPDDGLRYRFCFKWFYARVKGEGKKGTDRTYLITAGQPSPPSQEFNNAVKKWQQ